VTSPPHTHLSWWFRDLRADDPAYPSAENEHQQRELGASRLVMTRSASLDIHSDGMLAAGAYVTASVRRETEKRAQRGSDHYPNV